MQKKSAKRKSNVKNLAIITTLTAIVLVVSTFAWFIALDEVAVNAFNVTMAPTEGLEFSIDGTTWYGGADMVGADGINFFDENLAIDETNYNTGAYAGNTNSWTGVQTPAGADPATEPAVHYGLIPMSSSGQIDPTSSRLVLFEKTSLTSTDLDAAGDLTTTEWGYRLMSDPVPNTGATEHKGYIAFDLLIKNTTEDQYYDDVDIQNEEPIYLTTDSVVTPGVDGHGLENSVRVAFAQIARVEIPEAGTVDAATITGMTCSAADAICRPAAIWEPNDTKHSTNSLEFYAANCTTRPYDAGSPGTCGALADGTASPTYAITTTIEAADAIDIYDGHFNGYTTSADTVGGTVLPKVIDMTNTDLLDSYYAHTDDTVLGDIGYYFTDTEKNTGVTYEADGTTIATADQDDRPAFMYLAPNSITKVRVYVWLEGQDIDNYDWASLGESINVNFGFTKQQLSDEIR